MKIAIAGKAGSGKNLFFEIARQEFPNYHFKELKLAEPIYDCMYAVQNQLGKVLQKDGKLLQILGNHYRENDPDFWIRRFFRNNATGLNPGNVIVTDVRFPNELKALKLNGYTVVRIYRQDEYRLNNLGNRNSKDVSETALDKTPDSTFDYIINNNNSLEAFEGAVINIVKDIRRKEDNRDSMDSFNNTAI